MRTASGEVYHRNGIGFKVEAGLYQRLVLCPFLFAMGMDGLTNDVRQQSPLIMMFGDEIVICSETIAHVEEVDGCTGKKNESQL